MQVSKIYKYESLFLGNEKKINDKKEGSKGKIIIITDDINKMLFFAMVIFIILHARHYFKPIIKENLRKKEMKNSIAQGLGHASATTGTIINFLRKDWAKHSFCRFSLFILV